MSIDTNKDGSLSADEIVTAAQGFLTTAVSDVLRVIAATSSALVLALTLWQAMHPAVVAPVPTTGPLTAAGYERARAIHELETALNQHIQR